jgi:rubredoxin
MDDSILPGSFGGDTSKIKDDTKLECKICWHIYNPEEGDDYWQIAPGTPFSKLPEDWSCPECDGNKNEFMVIN